MKVRITLVYEAELDPTHYDDENLSAEEMVEEEFESDMAMFLSQCDCIEHSVVEVESVEQKPKE